ncbi:Fe-S cluster protein [Candidatus Falkowbacteria bacterium HGW-Falkowbacteria-2]|uniref:Fe-S cluster protein n=1 Tax=Candidatus Falkowbacteria bacterium HGW-Falkowbacteria-2 TaxID=2013769 RepID=A0A2N2E253_9BACT|nr:MAG: Fe-S cluster protein [Candidatus Falkowbacteria bacterium HGW-Falkowbacteria-2]
MDIYARNILDHYQRPRHQGVIVDADAVFGKLNRSCGDEIKVYVKTKNGLLEAVSFETRGCAISTASISILSDELLEKTVGEIMQMDLADIQPYLGIEISPRRQRCALLGLRAIQGALAKLTEKTEKTSKEEMSQPV